MSKKTIKTMNAIALVYKRDNSYGADSSAFKFNKSTVIIPTFSKINTSHPGAVKYCFIQGEDRVKNDMTGMTSVIQCGQYKQCNYIFLDLNKANSQSALKKIIDDMIDRHIRSKAVNSLYFAFQISDLGVIEKENKDGLIYEDVQSFISINKGKVA